MLAAPMQSSKSLPSHMQNSQNDNFAAITLEMQKALAQTLESYIGQVLHSADRELCTARVGAIAAAGVHTGYTGCVMGYCSNEQVINHLLHLIVQLALFPRPYSKVAGTQFKPDSTDGAVQACIPPEQNDATTQADAVAIPVADESSQTILMTQERGTQVIPVVKKSREAQATVCSRDAAQMTDSVDKSVSEVAIQAEVHGVDAAAQASIFTETIEATTQAGASTSDVSAQAVAPSHTVGTQATAVVDVVEPISSASARGVRIGGGYDLLRRSLDNCIQETVKASSPHRIGTPDGAPRQHMHGAPSKQSAPGNFGVGVYGLAQTEAEPSHAAKAVKWYCPAAADGRDVRLFRVLRSGPATPSAKRRPASSPRSRPAVAISTSTTEDASAAVANAETPNEPAAFYGAFRSQDGRRLIVAGINGD